MLHYLKFRIYPMTLVLLFILELESSAQTSIAFIGHLNNDVYTDTLIAQYVGNNVHLPSTIRWGRPTKNLPRLTTVYSYPANWKDLQGSFFVDYINNDTIADIVINIKGKFQINDTFRDTSCFLTIFGSEPIAKDTVLIIDKIRIIEATGSQYVEMKKGVMLVDEANRSLSGGRSYKIAKINTSKQERHNIDTRITEQPTPSVSAPEIVIYPNPGQSTITAQFTGIAVGEYSLDVMDVIGVDIHKYPFEVTAKGANTYSIQLDVSLYPTGIYVLRLFTNSKHVISSQFMINH